MRQVVQFESIRVDPVFRQRDTNPNSLAYNVLLMKKPSMSKTIQISDSDMKNSKIESQAKVYVFKIA